MKGPAMFGSSKRRVFAADDVQLAGLAVVDVRDAGVIIGAAPGVDRVRAVARAEEAGAGEEAAALRIGDLRAVQRRVVARRRDLLLAVQLLRVQADVARQRAVGRDLPRRQADLRDTRWSIFGSITDQLNR
jgi:hypothetical protein